MEIEAGAKTGDDYGGKSAGRLAQRNGLSYDFLGSFAIREPLPGTPNMPGSGGGRIENGSATRAVR